MVALEMIRTYCSNLWNTLHAPEGGYLIRRYISFLGHLVAMIIMMKLTWMGGMTENYFMIYTAFIAGHATLEKYVASKNQAATGEKKE